jgi:V8-like Glu-specific endopeptidase
MNRSERPEVVYRHPSGEPQTEVQSHPAPDKENSDDTPVASDQPEHESPHASRPHHGELGAPLPGLAPSERAGILISEQILHAGSEPQLPDAWYAEFGHPAFEAVLRRPESTAALSRLTADADDRVQVGETEAYPWRCVCSLLITAADGTRWCGTGWLAGPRTVVTAGHCVYMHAHGGWVAQVEVAPGRIGTQHPYGVAVATSFRSVRGWTQLRQLACNYGAVILPADHAVGNLLGFLGFRNESELNLRRLNASLAGYSCDKPSGTLWYCTRRLDMITPRTLEYAIHTHGGESGAPVWYLRNHERYVVGIHTNGDARGGAAVRIGAPVFENLSAWKRAGTS